MIELAIASSAFKLIGGLMNAYGQQEKGEAEARQLQYRAQIARQNAAIARENSNIALEAGERNARRSGMTTGFTIARQKVGQAASGFDVNTGTNADVRDSTQAIGLEDQSTIRREAGIKALGERNRASMLEADATMGDEAARQVRSASRVSVLGTLLGTASSVADKWTQGSQAFGSASTGITTYDENFMPVAFTPT